MYINANGLCLYAVSQRVLDINTVYNSITVDLKLIIWFAFISLCSVYGPGIRWYLLGIFTQLDSAYLLISHITIYD